MKKIWIVCLLISGYQLCAHTTLLIKIPTRSRPHQFFKNLDKFYQNLSFTVPYKFLISCDEDDASMNNPSVKRRLQSYPHLEYRFHNNSYKLEAHNKDLQEEEFDVLLLLHDDMEPSVKHFDKIIYESMIEYFPDLDGVINFNDGFVGGQCNTLPVMGRTFYERFGYVYHPSYKSLVGNVELTLVSKILCKEKVLDTVIIKHNHPAWNTGLMDDLYRKNEKYHQEDLENFVRRRLQNFGLREHDIADSERYVWSILICTISEREESCKRLCTKLRHQIEKEGLGKHIEVLCCKDNKGEHSVGSKRNLLLEQSRGKYVCFLDDDDDIHDHYIELIYAKLKNNPDNVSLTGIITVDGAHPQKFIHSRKYKTYFEENSIYYRPPNHLNPIRRSVAIQFRFPEKNFGEDTEWALAIAQSGLLKKEETIDIPYYFYLYHHK